MIDFIMVVSYLGFYGCSVKAYFDNEKDVFKAVRPNWAISRDTFLVILSAFKAKDDANRHFLNELQATQRMQWGKLLFQRHIALRKGWRVFRDQHGLQPSAKHILPTIIVDHNMHKGGADKKTREHCNISGLWEKYLTPTQRIVTHALKHTFGQPFHLFWHARIIDDVQRGKVKTFRQV
jgi:hypothetical protein